MSDLISRQDVIDLFKNYYTGLSMSADEAYYKILYILRTLPSVESKRKKGSFIRTEYDGYADGNPVYYEWKCSECGCIFEDDEPTYNFARTVVQRSKEKKKMMNKTTFKPGDKFILELGERRLDEYEIAGTDLYVKIYLLEKLTPYKPETAFLTAEPKRIVKVVDTWKVAGYDELNAWCPECEHRITRGCSYCPTCGVKLEWSKNE